MLFWLLDKVKESSQNEASRQRYEAEKRDAEKARIRINDLCKAEVERLGKSPVIVEVYNSVFNTGRCVEKFITKNDGIVVFLLIVHLLPFNIKAWASEIYQNGILPFSIQSVCYILSIGVIGDLSWRIALHITMYISAMLFVEIMILKNLYFLILITV